MWISSSRQTIQYSAQIEQREYRKFNKAAEDVKNLKSKPSDADLLEIYALFKQGSIGDHAQECWTSKEKPNGMPGTRRKALIKTLQRNNTSQKCNH
nr:unnamed protein product [Callosobruchus chinensis]